MIFEAHELPTGIRANALVKMDGIVAITVALKHDLATKLGIAQENLLVASDGVPEAWTQVSTNKRDARHQLGWDGVLPYVIYTGNLSREVYANTLEFLIDIARMLEGEAQIIQIGNPPTFQNQSHQPPPNLRFLGLQALERVRLFQAAADVLILPYSSSLRYVHYMSPIKLFEYMAAGRPIVAFDLPVLREVLIDKVNAILVQQDDPIAMAEGIRLVLEESDFGYSISNKARHHAKAYTWEKRAKKIIDFASELRGARIGDLS